MQTLLVRIICLLFIALSPAVLAAAEPDRPITFLGIHWHMTEPEMTAELESQGYTCNSIKEELLGSYPVCRKGSAVITILTNFGVADFNCAAFDGCDLSQDEIAQKLVTLGVVSSMDAAGSDYYGETEYCGDGALGDVICVDSTGQVFLHRARLRAMPAGEAAP
ncbi:MAG: hypothetical protein P8Z33_13215 [Gammaproteobacteria bacterium]